MTEASALKRANPRGSLSPSFDSASWRASWTRVWLRKTLGMALRRLQRINCALSSSASNGWRRKRRRWPAISAIFSPRPNRLDRHEGASHRHPASQTGCQRAARSGGRSRDLHARSRDARSGLAKSRMACRWRVKTYQRPAALGEMLLALFRASGAALCAGFADRMLIFMLSAFLFTIEAGCVSDLRELG